ncbi:ATP-binding protein [Microcoleus sp. F10-C6]|uniref:ATP-binding protein n=1 Tax=unclassified Microcoleus TaxID=2642155 RepID=UPI002FD6C758
MVNSETTSLNVTTSKFSLLSQLDELRSAWQEDQSARAKGGFLALSGFEHQFLLVLLKIVYRWKEASKAERQDLNTAHEVLTEAISDITESGKVVTLTQVKRTLSGKAIGKALEELWEIFNLASKHTPGLVEHLRFKISGKFEDNKNPNKVIKEWNPILQGDQAQRLDTFKTCVSYEFVADPRTDLTTELENLSRDEDTETTIGRWLGYLLQLGSGLSPERISALIWRELINDKSLEAFRATQARLFSLSHYRLRVVRHTLGGSLSLPRTDLLSQLQASVLTKRITLLIGPSGSGKSALCKLAMQKNFPDYTRLFLHPSDIISFTETPDSTSSRTRRIDELLTAQVIEKPIIIIDDLSDVNDQSFDCVLNLLQNALASETSTDVRFVLVAHLDAERRVRDKIDARLGAELSIDVVKLPQLPINDLQSSHTLPADVASLVQRADEFGPALNLKLLDWLISSVQRDDIDASAFKNDLDLLAWFWRFHVNNGRDGSEEGRALIRTAISLANKFTPDLSLYDSEIDSKVLDTLVRRDCLRVAEEKVAVTHRFVGDCARFRYLLGKRRELDVSKLATKLRNPLWSQPVRWFALYLAMESEETETWQELLQEAKEGNHLQLIDLLLDGAILSRQPSSVLQGCSGEHLPFFIKHLISRLLAIATFPNPALAGISESTSAGTRLVIQEQITGIPKAHLWEPVWRWLLSQNPETVIEESCLVFRAAEAWLNWGIFAEKFSFRVEVAEFVLNLLQRILLPDPDPPDPVPEARVDSWEDLNQIIELRQKGALPFPVHKKQYYLRDFSSNAFACIVFALKIIPERSAWFLKVLAGREITPANRLEATETSLSLIRPGVGVLEPPHPKGPSGKVNNNFRKFMLKQGGLYLNYVVSVNPQLGAELLLALTISPPGYHYEFDNDHNRLINSLGTKGSDEIDVCTFKFIPLLSLLQINEVVAIDVIATLCKVATDYWHEHRWAKNKLEGMPETDTDGVTLLIGENRKDFKGGRHALYWHRKYTRSPNIVACFLMTLEGWLYSRPTKAALERSISIIFERADTVAILGLLISLAKCAPNLLKGSLLPLLSSLQLLIWLDFEEIDRGQDFAFDYWKAWNRLSKEEYQELAEFHQLSHRKISILEIALRMWLEGDIPFDATSQILADWDNHQLNFIPEVSRYRALKIRAWFEGNNWLSKKDEHGTRIFHFVGTLPQDAEVDAKAESALWNLQHLEIVRMCRKVLDGELQKTPELDREFVTLLTSEEQLTSLQERLGEKAFIDIIWAAIAVILEFPIDNLNPELENYITDYASDFSNLPISLDDGSRCQNYNRDAEAFLAHGAPKLLRRCKSETLLRSSAFRCFIGVRNCNTSAFMSSWIREYGLVHPLTQELINIAPRIARLLFLTYAVPYAEEISKREKPQIEEVWSSLQKDFEEKKNSGISISDVSQWIPEILIQPLQQQPRWLHNYFDWDFLAAALIPVLKAKPDSEIELDLISLLREQVLFALLHERATVYVDNKAEQEEDGDDSVETQLYSAQSQIIDTIVKSNSTEFATRINVIFQVFKTVELVDCIVLGEVIDTLSYCIVEENSSDIIDHSFRKYTACTVGEYLFGLRNQQEPNLRFFGSVRDIWEKLIDLLWQWSKKNLQYATQADQWLMEFLERFQEVLLPDWWLRIKLYRVGQLTNYRHFRRLLFKMLIQNQEILPTSRNDESELLVQLLAELWDSDPSWIIHSPLRRSGLRTLLGQLQEIDALGARRLGDEIANSLAHGSD